MRSIDPSTLSIPARHQYILGSVGPRPIALASTIDDNGIPNLSPFSFFNFFSSNPPVGIISPARRGRDNTTKDSFENVKSVREVVINIVTYNMVHQTNLSSTEYDPSVDEFKKAGFTPLEAEKVRPFRVKESPVQFECQVRDVIELGDQGAAGNLILCEAIRFHIDEDLLDENGQIDQTRIDLVGRMGGDWYCRAHGDALFPVQKPKGSGIGLDAIPPEIRESEVLTGNDLGRLGGVESLPDETEVNEFKLNELSDTFLELQDEPEKLKNTLHQMAKRALEAENDLHQAWCILLSYNG